MFAVFLLFVSLIAYLSSHSKPINSTEDPFKLHGKSMEVPWKMGMKEFTKCVPPGKLYASVVGLI